MSEWDYLPTPYETLVNNETEQMLLRFMSFLCLMEGRVLKPSEIFILCGKKDKYNWFLNDIIKKTSLNEVIRMILQNESLRNRKKQEELVEVLKDHVRRRGEKNL